MKKQSVFYNSISIILSFVFLWTNCAYGIGLSCQNIGKGIPDKLAVGSHVEDIILGAQLMYTGDIALKTMFEKSIGTNRDIYLNIDKLREDYIKSVQGLKLRDKEKIGWLVLADGRYTDEEKPYTESKKYEDYKAYYVFTGNGIFFRYTPIVEIGQKEQRLEVKDDFQKVLQDYGKLHKQGVATVINGKKFYREEYRITEENLGFINKCVRNQLGEILVPARGKGKVKKETSELRFKGAIFDLNGTITDTEKMYFNAYRNLLIQEGYVTEFTIEQYRQYLSGIKTNEGLCRYLHVLNRVSTDKYSELQGDERAEIDRLTGIKSKYVEKAIEEEQIDSFNDAINLIRYLKSLGLKLAVATSSSMGLKILEKVGILDLFDAVITGKDVKKGKPYPDPYLVAAEKIGLKPNECIAFEDANNGIQSAKSAGLYCVGIDRAGNEELLKGADVIVKNLDRLGRDIFLSRPRKKKGSVGLCLKDLYYGYGLKPVTVQKMIRGRGLSETTVRKELEMLEKLGLIAMDRSEQTYRYKIYPGYYKEVIDKIVTMKDLDCYEIAEENLPATKQQIVQIIEEVIKDLYRKISEVNYSNRNQVEEAKGFYRRIQGLTEALIASGNITLRTAIEKRWHKLLELSMKLEEKGVTGLDNRPFMYSPTEDIYNPESNLQGWKQSGPYDVGVSKGSGEKPGASEAGKSVVYINRAYSAEQDVMRDSNNLIPMKVMFSHTAKVFGRDKSAWIRTNSFPVVENHFMIVDTESVRQQLELDFLRTSMGIISQMDGYTFSYNSIGAHSSINHPHIHGYKSATSLLDNVNFNILKDIDGIRIGELDQTKNQDYPVKGFVIEYNKNKDPDKVSILAHIFAQNLMIRNIPHTIVFRNNRIFIFPRKPITLGEFGQSYAGFEYAGRILMTDMEMINTPYAKANGIDKSGLSGMKSDERAYSDFVRQAFASIDVDLIKSGFSRLNLDDDVFGQLKEDLTDTLEGVAGTKDIEKLERINPYVWLSLYKSFINLSGDSKLLKLINLLLERYMIMTWLNGDEVKEYPQEAISELQSKLQLDVSDEELIERSGISEEERDLLLLKITSMDKEIQGGVEKNMEDILKILFGLKEEYVGYDVIILASTTEDERKVAEEQFEALFKDKGVIVLSVKLDVFEGGTTMDSMRAYEKAREIAQTRGLNLDNLWNEGKKICIVPNAGKASRCSPITQSENNSRGDIKLSGKIITKDGVEVPINLLILVYAQNAIFAKTNNGEIDIFYASQVYLPNRILTGQKSPDTLLTKFVQDITREEEIIPDRIRDLGMFELDGSGNMVVNYPKGTFKTIDEAKAKFRQAVKNGNRLAFSCGSHRIKKPIFDALKAFFGDLNNPSLKFEPPHFIMPLLLIFRGLREINIDLQNNNLNTVKDVLEKLPPYILNDLAKKDESGDYIKNESGLKDKNHLNAIRFYLQNKSNTQLGNPSKWFGAFGIGSDVYWWRYRRPAEVLNSQLLMLTDLAGTKVQVGDNGKLVIPAWVTYSDKQGAKLLRKLKGVQYPVSDCIFGTDRVDSEGRRVSDGKVITEDDIRKGIDIGGVYIKGSIVLGSIVTAGSRIVNSIVERSNGIIKADNSFIENTRVRSLDAHEALVYNVVEKGVLEVIGKTCVDVFRPDISLDDRFPKGQTRMIVKFDVDAQKMDKDILPDTGNIYSFQGLRELNNEPSENLKIRSRIIDELPSIPLWISSDGQCHIDLYSINKPNPESIVDVLPELDSAIIGMDEKIDRELSKQICDAVIFVMTGELQKNWIITIDVRGKTYQLRYKRPANLYQEKMLMISDLTERYYKIDVDGILHKLHKESPGATEKFEDFKRQDKAMREFKGIKYPIASCTIGKIIVDAEGWYTDGYGQRKQITFDDVRRGIIISDVYIKDSLIQDSKIDPGSHIRGSIVTDTKGTIWATHSYIYNSEVSYLKTYYALVYNVVEREESLEVGYTSVSDVFGPAIDDPRFSGGQTRMWVGYGVDGKAIADKKLIGLQDLFTIPSDFKGAIFDLDGVIASTGEQHFQAWKRMFEEEFQKNKETKGMKFTRDDYQKYVSGKTRYDGCLAMLAASGILRFAKLARQTKGQYVYPGSEKYSELKKEDRDANDQVMVLGDIKDGYYQELLNTERLKILPGVIALLEDLKRREIKTAIVSSSKSAESILRQMGIFERFDAMVSGVDIEASKKGPNPIRGKPAPDAFLLAARRLGLKPGECVGFEDAINGVEAIKAANMPCVGVNCESRKDLKKADVVVSDLREVQCGEKNNFSFNEIRRLKAVKPADFKGVVFDLDGVISTTGRQHSQAWKWLFDSVFEQYDETKGRKFTQKDYEDYVSGKERYKGCLAMLVEAEIQKFVALSKATNEEVFSKGTEGYKKLSPELQEVNDEVRRLADRKYDKYTELLNDPRQIIEALKGAEALLRDLKRRGILLGLASSSTSAKIILKKIGLLDMFGTYIVDGIDIKESKTAESEEKGIKPIESKPLPHMFLETAKKMGLRPDECVGFEDAIAGVAAIKAAGMPCIGVNGESHEKLPAAESAIGFLDEIDFRGLDSLVFIDTIQKMLGVNQEDLDAVLREEKEPSNSWESLLYYLKEGKLRFSIRDEVHASPYGTRTDPLVAETPVSITRMYKNLGDKDEKELIIDEDAYINKGTEKAKLYTFYYYSVDISKKAWESQKIYRREFLAKVIIHAWIEHFMPYADTKQIPIPIPHEKYFVNNELLQDINRAQENNDVEFLYQLLIGYNISTDPAGTTKEAIYKAIAEIENKKGAQFLADNIGDDLDLLAWYRYQIEGKNLSVPEISRLLEDNRQNEVVDRNLGDNNQYLFRYGYRRSGADHIRCFYLPQGIGFMPGLNQFSEERLMVSDPHEDIIKDQKRQMAQMIERRDALRSNRDRLREQKEELSGQNKSTLTIDKRIAELISAINNLNRMIYGTVRNVLQHYDTPIITKIANKVEEMRKAKPENCIVIGIYGPAGTGKSTMSEFLVDYLIDNVTRDVNYIGLDSYLYQGEGFRYKMKNGARHTFLNGQGIYNLKQFYHDLMEIKSGHEIETGLDKHAPQVSAGLTRRKVGPNLKILVIDIPCLAIDRRIANEIDILLPAVFRDDAERLRRRMDRDTRPEEEKIADDGKTRALSKEYLLQQFALFQFTEVHDNMAGFISEYARIVWQQDKNVLLNREEISGPIGKTVDGGNPVENLWQADIKDDGTLDNIQVLNQAHPKFAKVNPQKLQDVLYRIREKQKYGIFAVADRVRFVDNLGADRIKKGEKGMVPYATMIEEDNKVVLLIDVDAFDDDNLLYLNGDHELKHSIMHIIPGRDNADKAIEELTVNYLSLKQALDEGIKVDKAKLKELGADLQFFEALEVLQAMKNVSDNDIIAVAIEHMKGMPYYAELFKKFPFAGEWRKAVGEITEAKARYEAALRVFNNIMEAKIGKDEAEKQGLKGSLERAVKEVKVNIRVMNTFTGEKRVVGLEGLPGLVKKGIGAIAKAIWSRDDLKEGLERYITRSDVKIPETKWMVISSERRKQLEEAVGKDVIEEQIKLLGSMTKDGVKVFSVVDEISKVPEDAFNKENPRVMYLFDFADWDKVNSEVGAEKMDRMMYFPTLYTSSTLYIGAQLLITGGRLELIGDTLAGNIIMQLYSAVLGREATAEDLNRLFRSPWTILPQIVGLIENINAIRNAVVQIEKAA